MPYGDPTKATPQLAPFGLLSRACPDTGRGRSDCRINVRQFRRIASTEAARLMVSRQKSAMPTIRPSGHFKGTLLIRPAAQLTLTNPSATAGQFAGSRAGHVTRGRVFGYD
jgi:hypothetical protein